MSELTPQLRRLALAVIVLLALFVFPAMQLTESVRSGRNHRLQMLNAERIAVALRQRIDAAGLAAASSSTEVFNRLLATGDVVEKMFNVPGFEPLKRCPDDDGKLQPEENCFALVVGLPEHPAPRAPLLLWDPGLVKRPPFWSVLRPAQWLWVNSRGKASLDKQRAFPFGRWRGEKDFLPEVPGEQRLLRP